MQLYNRSQQCLMVSDIALAQTFWASIQGLIGSTSTQALYLKTRWGLHSIGMQRTLTVLICDGDFKVCQISTLRPWKILWWNPRWLHIFELPYDTYRVKIGDHLQVLAQPHHE